MTIEEKLLDRLIEEVRAPGLRAIENMRGIEQSRAILLDMTEKYSARIKDAEPKLAELYKAAEKLMLEVELHPRSNHDEKLRLSKVVRRALENAYKYCDQVPF